MCVERWREREREKFISLVCVRVFCVGEPKVPPVLYSSVSVACDEV